jgi:uncharacterized protein (DUF433 family)
MLQSGQIALREFLEAYLQRVEHDASGHVVRLYPFTRKRDLDEPKVVVIDPHVSYGRPVLVGTGIPTAIVAERYKAGESIDELAEDYGRARKEIEEAIRCEDSARLSKFTTTTLPRMPKTKIGSRKSASGAGSCLPRTIASATASPNERRWHRRK